MKVVILSAGDGTRLKELTKDLPKPLLKLYGKTLIEHVISNCKSHGFNDFLIVIGYKGELIKEYLENKNLDVNLTFINNPQWQTKGNGHSLLITEEYLKEDDRFLVVMADHIFATPLLDKLKNLDNKNVLCCDFQINKNVNIKEATKVKVEKDKIVELGKDLKDYDAIDCGVFLLSAEIFTALKEAEKYCKTTLTDAVNILASQDKLTYFDISDTKWWDIDEKKDYFNAQKEYIETVLIKPTDGIVSKYINRKLSRIITKFLINTKIIPNQITIFSFILILLGSLFIVLGLLPIGGILIQLASIIDGCDGEVARLKNQVTKFGAFFDSILDRYADFIIIGALTYGAYFNYSTYAIIAGMIALAGVPLSMLQSEKFKALTNVNYDRKYEGYLRYLQASRDTRLFIVFIGCLFYLPFHILIILGIITHLKTILRLVIVRRIIDKM